MGNIEKYNEAVWFWVISNQTCSMIKKWNWYRSFEIISCTVGDVHYNPRINKRLAKYNRRGL